MNRREVSKFVKTFDFEIQTTSFETICEGARKLLKIIDKNWKDDEVKFQEFTDGLTNRLIGCFVKEGGDMVLVRIYGKYTELFIDRYLEIRNMNLMFHAGIGAPLYCAFKNGLCYGYSPGETLDQRSVRDPHISKKIAHMMAKMHCISPTEENGSTPSHPALFRFLWKFHQLTPNEFTDPEIQKRFQEALPSKAKLKEEIDYLVEELSSLDSPLVFCHNDLLLKNIIFDKKSDKVTFVDFEYADYNFEAFDIGNHFCEFSGIEDFDFSLYPDLDFQRKWLHHYLEGKQKATMANGHHMDGSSLAISKENVEDLLIKVNKFALAAHFMWALWSLVQAEHSTLDFDYLGYAIARFQQYFQKKASLMNLKV